MDLGGWLPAYEPIPFSIKYTLQAGAAGSEGMHHKGRERLRYPTKYFSFRQATKKQRPASLSPPFAKQLLSLLLPNVRRQQASAESGKLNFYQNTTLSVQVQLGSSESEGGLRLA